MACTGGDGGEGGAPAAHADHGNTRIGGGAPGSGEAVGLRGRGVDFGTVHEIKGQPLECKRPAGVFTPFCVYRVTYTLSVGFRHAIPACALCRWKSRGTRQTRTFCRCFRLLPKLPARSSLTSRLSSAFGALSQAGDRSRGPSASAFRPIFRRDAAWNQSDCREVLTYAR
ncbi:hypothetical protein Salmuc_03984 [Salipiger mucosus DSM 16094]|uniref:Uncharacterized protein n=1 Tax=Salipiger mucosus DSM 16094 TaxID=1123237 RepID=S9QFH3_9RHOB|nr:hypothetical protein Salmuc_03984 [Salipiger mucosus DSM 16094]